jgi:hypothetical protein
MSLLNDFLKLAPIKHKRGLVKSIDTLEENNVLRLDKKQNKLFIKLELIEHIFDKRFTDIYEVTPYDIPSLYYHYLYDNEYGPVIWIIKNKNKMPRKAVADFLNGLANSKNKIMYELVTMNLKSNIEP